MVRTGTVEVHVETLQIEETVAFAPEFDTAVGVDLFEESVAGLDALDISRVTGDVEVIQILSCIAAALGSSLCGDQVHFTETHEVGVSHGTRSILDGELAVHVRELLIGA